MEKNEIQAPQRLSIEDLEAEGAALLPDKEVLSIIDLFVNLDIAIDLAAPVDLAVAANANVAAPIDAAVGANVLSIGSTSTALADQGVMLDQYISGEAIATAPQDAVIDQSNDVVDGGTTGGTTDGTETGSVGGNTETGTTPTDGVSATNTSTADLTGVDLDGTVDDTTDTVGGIVGGVTESGLLDGPLVNVEVDVALDADLAAPIAGAVAANANVAAPIDVAATANIGTINSTATAMAEQDAIITQTMEDVSAQATADQVAEITQ